MLAGPAQPFATVPNPALDGPGPNPLLQNHYLMVIHPPFLYSGYVGMTIPFGLACAALLVGRLGNDFIRPLRNFLLVSWIFLTCAIVLGGWWAYEVLGWGGYWAWDPVENASFLPWLTATAALHSAMLVERKGVLKGWTVILVLATYLLTILGTFMTRSGVFNSVHSFTQSAIGPTILVFLAAALLFSLVLLALRVDSLGSEGRLETGPSRDVMFLVQNLLFVLFTFTVLLGTVFPLVVEALRGAQMSVGRPYFDKMSVPIGVALLFVMGVGPALPWGRATRQQLRSALLPPLLGACLLAAVGFALGVRNPWTILALLFGGFTAQVTLSEMFLPVRQRMRARGEGLAEAFRQAQSRGRRRFGAYIVHAGAVVVIAAIAVSSTMGSSKEVQLNQGETTTLGAYQLTFLRAEQLSEPHRQSVLARVDVSKNGRSLGMMFPRMSQYESQREPIGSPAVHTGLTEDLYLSIHNIDGASVGLLVLINPMVSWCRPYAAQRRRLPRPAPRPSPWKGLPDGHRPDLRQRTARQSQGARRGPGHRSSLGRRPGRESRTRSALRALAADRPARAALPARSRGRWRSRRARVSPRQAGSDQLLGDLVRALLPGARRARRSGAVAPGRPVPGDRLRRRRSPDR